MRQIILAVAAIACAAPALVQPVAAQPADPAVVEKYVAATFRSASPEWQARVKQDATQQLCSLRRNEPTTAEATEIQKREAANVKLPADGKVIGEWKKGEKVAQNGRGGQFSDPPGTVSGGNCYACHQMAGAEVSYGTLGPSLLQYGKLHDYDPKAAVATFVKIYNPQSVVACSNMPRFGHNGILTEAQIRDVVAYLFDPASPVNQ